MQELHKDGMSLDQILKICRDEFPNSMVKMSDVFNTIYRGRGDDLTEVMKMVGESVRYISSTTNSSFRWTPAVLISS